MKDGAYRYRFEMSVPLGIRRGELHICLSGGAARGTLTALGKTCELAEVRYEDGRLRAAGILETLLYALPFELHGVMDETSVHLEMATAKGNFTIEGAGM